MLPFESAVALEKLQTAAQHNGWLTDYTQANAAMAEVRELKAAKEELLPLCKKHDKIQWQKDIDIALVRHKNVRFHKQNQNLRVTNDELTRELSKHPAVDVSQLQELKARACHAEAEAAELVDELRKERGVEVYDVDADTVTIEERKGGEPARKRLRRLEKESINSIQRHVSEAGEIVKQARWKRRN